MSPDPRINDSTHGLLRATEMRARLGAERHEATSRVLRAVADPGPAPGEHQRQIERLAAEWRPLARALAGLLEAHGVAAPKEWK